jgi:hypothetical protein
MGSLAEVVTDDGRRRAVVDDCARLLDAEVSDKRGIKGMAVKAAFKAVKGVRPGMIPMSVDALLDDFATQIDPFWDACQSSGTAPRSYFQQNGNTIANALLKITDDRAQKSTQRVLKGAYSKLRGQAVTHITQAMPRLADLVARHAG